MRKKKKGLKSIIQVSTLKKQEKEMQVKVEVNT